MRRRLALFTAALALSGCVSGIIESRLNVVGADSDSAAFAPGEHPSEAGFFVADLHADTMLWERDFLLRADRGHVDLPRLVEGGVALQVMAVVTKTPDEQPARPSPRLVEGAAPVCIPSDGLNTTALLHVAQLRPVATWFDLEARAMHQAARLRRFAEESARARAADPDAPLLLLIEDADDLAELIERRRTDRRVVGSLLALEGAHWVEGDDAAVDAAVGRLFDAGFRMLAPTHRFDNALASSSEGCDQLGGLTPAGEAFVRAVNRRGVALDLAHAADLAVQQAVALSAGPMVVSHTGLRFRCPQDDEDGRRCVIARGMRMQDVQAVARAGGVVGIGFWPQAVGWGTARIAQAFRAAHEALSEPAFVAEMRRDRPGYDPFDHIAFGSDFDGAVETPFDTTGLRYLLTALRDAGGPEGFETEALRKLTGGNVCRVLATRLPGGGPERATEICAPILRGPA